MYPSVGNRSYSVFFLGLALLFFFIKNPPSFLQDIAQQQTPESLYDITVKDISGSNVSLSTYSGKVLLIVNVASKCGLTHKNYNEMNILYEKYKDKGLEILAFPCNQFLSQEPGSNEEIQEAACTILKAEFPIFDKDGLFLVTNNLDLVKGNSLAILTPNVNEYKRLLEKVLQSEVNDQNASEQLASLARSIGGVTILRKGKTDLICDGLTVNEVSILGSPRRCGGQGDILSGSVAVFSSWARHYLSTLKNENGTPSSLNPMVLGSISGSALLRKAASIAFEKKKRSTLTTDIIECMGKSLEDICPAY